MFKLNQICAFNLKHNLKMLVGRCFEEVFFGFPIIHLSDEKKQLNFTKLIISS